MLSIGGRLAQVQAAHRERFQRLYSDAGQAGFLALVPIRQCEYLQADDNALARWLDEALTKLEAGLADAGDEQTFRPLIVEFWPLGVHYVDALFGASVHARDGNFWSDYLDCGLAELQPVNLSSHPLVNWTLEAMQTILTRLPQEICLTTPVLSSPLNIAVNLFGQRALVDLVAPAAGHLRGMQIITDAIAGLHRLFRRRFPPSRVRFYASSHRFAPDGFGHICGCTTQLVGPGIYAEHVGPLDAAVLREYPHGGTIHLCGHHTQHLPCWAGMKELRGVQLNDAAADDFELYYRRLRDDQVIYIGPTRRMPVERILAISDGGRRVVLQTHSP